MSKHLIRVKRCNGCPFLTSWKERYEIWLKRDLGKAAIGLPGAKEDLFGVLTATLNEHHAQHGGRDERFCSHPRVGTNKDTDIAQYVAYPKWCGGDVELIYEAS